MKEQSNIRHIRYFRIISVMIIASILTGAITYEVFRRSKNSAEETSSQQSQAVSTTTSYENSGSSIVQTTDSMNDLKEKISAKFEDYPGDWSAYVKNLNTGECFCINDRQIYPASIIKLFALGACYQKIEEGALNEKDCYNDLYGMTVMSNNKAFNSILWAIGKDYLTQWCTQHGYTHTKQYHGLEPADNADGLTTEDKPNETCASDVGRMLESIYRGECVSKSASEKMLDLLSKQYWTSKIPFGLPNHTRFANKTGDTSDQSHDGAIVYSAGADYILVIMSEVPQKAFDQDHRFIEISSMVYKYFNPAS